MKDKILLALRVLVSLAFIGLLAWFFRKDLPDVLAALKDINPFLFTMAVALNVSAFVVISVRLQKIFSVQGLRLKLGEAVYLTFIGNFFNNFLPTSVGGDLVKAYYATKKSARKLESFSAVFFDRFFGFLSIGLLAFFGVLFLHTRVKDAKLLWGSALFSAAVFLSFIFFLNKGLVRKLFARLFDLPFFSEGSKLRKLYNALNAYKEHKAVIAQLIGISLLAQLISVAAIYVIIRSLSQEISFLSLFLIIPLVAVASMMPSINGLGVREGAFVYFLKEFISRESAVAVSILYLAIILIMSLIGGVLYLFSGKFYKYALSDNKERAHVRQRIA